MKYLIDTNICIYIMNNRPADVIQKFKKVNLGEIGVSTITISELQYGVAKSQRPKNNQIRLNEFIAPLEILPYDRAAAKTYGDIRYHLEKIGQPIGPLDLLIAAQAVSQNLIVVTNNDKEFVRIRKLKVENWVD
ncbi:MAG: type II toxin-antitoxin system VapC family toxin [Desulfobacteraceae bacterium]